MALDVNELQSRLDDLRRAYLSGTLSIRFSDGKEQRFQSMGDMLKAIQTAEDWIRQASNQGTTSVAFAQFGRGETPSGGRRC